MEDNQLPQETADFNRIIPVNIEEQMKTAYIDYSMSVIVGRALPDVRDGLKPVHRRILFAMNELGMLYNRPYKKSARIVGEVLGKYHPHGDTAVYDAMVRMAQDWSIRYTLIDGQGNYGSQDGDGPAAMRYTEARLHRISESILQDIEKDTVDFGLNFDDSLKEPTVLPTRIPNLLVNGSSGIAVGMATNMMPHNLGEVIDGCIAYIDDREITVDGLMQYVKAPDFPTGGLIYGMEGIKAGFHLGRGRVVLRGKYTIDTKPSGREQIVITAVPYQVNRDALTDRIGQLVIDKTIEGVAHVNNESNNKEGTRIVIDLKRDAFANVIINQLFKYTELQTSYPKNKIKILLLENISEVTVKKFKAAGYEGVERLSKALSEKELVQKIKDYHLLGIRSKTNITPPVLQAAKKLQAIGCFCIGVNQVHLAEATRCGVTVFNAPYSNTRSVAELVIGAAIMLIRRIPDKNKAAHAGVWMKEASGSYELRGKTIGIIGYGNIGSQVSVLAENLGMRVLFYDTATKLPLGNASDAGSLKEVLKASDVVTLHIPETKDSKNLINKSTLKHFKKGSLLINYARGEVLDIAAVRKALEDGTLGGAAVDVFPVEPEKNGDAFETPLQNLPNVILTPHVGGSTEEAQQNIGEDVSSKLLQYLEKGITLGSHTVPALSLPPQEGAHRILHIHRNVPGVLSQINSQLSAHKINIVGQYLKTNEEIGYVVVDVDKQLSAQALALLRQVPETVKVRLLY